MSETALSKFWEMITCAAALGDTPRQKWEILWRQTKNLRVRLRLARYHPDQIFALPTRYGTVSLRDNVGDVTNLPDLLHRNVYRMGHLNGDGVILDIGANIGLFAAWAAWQNPERTIYCFEPLKSNARLVPLNCPTAILQNCGLGSERGVVTLLVDGHGAMASSIPTPWPTRPEQFEVIPLDEFTESNRIDSVAFMKVDTEGMELDVIQGGKKTLQRTRQIAMETHSESRHRETLQRLQASGFCIDDQAFSGATGFVYASRS